MSKNEIDYMNLENKIYKKAYRLSEVKDKIEKVAFDIVRFKDDDNAANLWQVQSADDGDYIVALYDQTQDKVVEASSSPWKVVVNHIGKSLNFYYKEAPIINIACSRLNIPEGEIIKAARYLPSKLSKNKKLEKSLLSELPADARMKVLAQYPELN